MARGAGKVQSLELENLQLELLNAQNDIALSAKVLAEMQEGSARGTVSEKSIQQAQTKHGGNGNALEIARSKWLTESSIAKAIIL